MIANAVKPSLLFFGELLTGSYIVKGAMNSLGSCVERFLFARCMLDHRNNIDERFVVTHLMRLLQGINCESFVGGTQLLAELTKCFCSPAFGAIKQNLNRLYLNGILFYKSRECGEVVF